MRIVKPGIPLLSLLRNLVSETFSNKLEPNPNREADIIKNPDL